jgi:RNA polymerase sigma factor (TIGR02999 family)
MSEEIVMAAVAAHPASDAASDVTRLLEAWSQGDSLALEELTPLVEGELRRLARKYMARQTPGHTLQPTALVHEAYLRLLGQRGASWHDREHFLAYMASAMRRLLINHARDRAAAKRGGTATHVAFDEAFDQHPEVPGAAQVDLLDLDQALRDLTSIDPRQGRVVELRYFGGLTVEETARVMDVSPRTVKREWHTARLWLLRALGGR